MPNVELRAAKLSSWRKIALGTWKTVGDPSVYGMLEINASKLVEKQKNWATKHSEKPPTITAIVARACAIVLHKHPQVNGMIRFGRIYNRKHVTLFLQAAVDSQGEDLSGVVIDNAEMKSLEAISLELKAKAKAIRANEDPNFKKTKNMFKIVPACLMKYLLDFTSFLMYTLNLDLRSFGLPKDPFGSVMITSIGMLGLDEAYAPLVPYSKVPLLLAVGSVKDRPAVIDGKITITPTFKICATFDHRFIDGMHGSKMVKHMRHLLETEEGLIELGF